MSEPGADHTLTVLHVWEPSTGGVEAHGRAVVADQRARGMQVHVLATSADTYEQGATTWQVSRRLRSLPGAMRQLHRVVQRVEPDVIHLHSSVAGVLGRVTIRGRVPTLFSPHAWSFSIGGRGARPLRWLERFLIRWTDTIVAVGDNEAATARDVLRTDRVVSVPNGIDLERFSPPSASTRSAARDELALPHDARVAVCVGRVTRQKGQDVVVAGWERVVASLPTAVLVLAGEVPEDRRADPGLGDRPSVRLLGAVDDVPSVLHAADLVVQPSRWEGLSYASIEALATGLPVVASDLAEIREVGADLFRYAAVDDIAGWADAVLEELATPTGGAAGADARRRRAVDGFDVRAQHARLADLVGEVADRAAAQSAGR